LAGALSIGDELTAGQRLVDFDGLLARAEDLQDGAAGVVGAVVGAGGGRAEAIQDGAEPVDDRVAGDAGLCWWAWPARRGDTAVAT
jgi:hypothetical protein